VTMLSCRLMTTVNIRPATLADIPAIITLERQCLSAAHWTDDQYRNLFEAEATRGSARRLMLAIEKKSAAASMPDFATSLLGFLIARNIDCEWELENIAVSPAARRQGLATMLIEELLRHAHEARGESVFLEVRESNHLARTLYEKLGFSQSGCRRGYYPNPPEDGILYRCLLP
jgi:[ribosomal protein S18]-alanine N-acetyltransferase